MMNHEINGQCPAWVSRMMELAGYLGREEKMDELDTSIQTEIVTLIFQAYDAEYDEKLSGDISFTISKYYFPRNRIEHLTKVFGNIVYPLPPNENSSLSNYLLRSVREKVVIPLFEANKWDQVTELVQCVTRGYFHKMYSAEEIAILDSSFERWKNLKIDPNPVVLESLANAIKSLNQSTGIGLGECPCEECHEKAMEDGKELFAERVLYQIPEMSLSNRDFILEGLRD